MSLLLRTLLTLLVVSRAPAFASSESVTQSAQDKKQTQNQINPMLFKHSLSGLYGIESYPSTATQPYSNFDHLYTHAQQAQTELELLCQNAALLTHSKTVFSGVKSKQRAQEKIETDLAGQVERITDLARATIIADDIGSLVSSFEQLEKQATIVGVKNRFKNPVDSGYRDLNVLLALPKSKIIAEVQLHLTDIEKVKSGPEHDIYEKIQEIERFALLENRPINAIEEAQIMQLRRQSVALYQEAWLPYISSNLNAA